MSIIEHQRGEKPSADSPGCEEYFVIECDVCGECWEVGPEAEELEYNRHVCAECEKAGEAIPSTSLLDCPFCGAPAEPSRPLKPTLEEAMTAEPHINCSRPKCAGRHVCATVAEWQFRQQRD